MAKRLCTILLLLAMGFRCAVAESGGSIFPYAPSESETAYAALLGMDEPHLLYAYNVPTQGNFHVNVYLLEHNVWLPASTLTLAVPAASGRMALFCDRLDERLRVILQDPQDCTSVTAHPLWGKAAPSVSLNQLSLCDTAALDPHREVPLVLLLPDDTDADLSYFDAPAKLPEGSCAVTVCYIPDQ